MPYIHVKEDIMHLMYSSLDDQHIFLLYIFYVNIPNQIHIFLQDSDASYVCSYQHIFLIHY